MSRSRFYENNLENISLDEDSLQKARRRLRQAILDGVGLIEAWSDRGLDQSIYTGTTGIAAMYERLRSQASALNMKEEDPLPAFATLTDRYLSSPDVPIRSRAVRPGILSPVDSRAGLATVRIIHSLQCHGSLGDSDVGILEYALESLQKDTTRTNEVLYGKAGLLFALLQLRGALGANESNERLVNLTSDRTLRLIVDAIMQEGTVDGSSQGSPLYFEWYGKCYLGAMHGLAGILTILLQCPLNFIDVHRTAIIRSINYLVQMVAENAGVLPSSLPASPSSRHRNPLVQLCHGSPGFLLLLATLEKMQPDWLTEIDDIQTATFLASDVVWKQGILIKGISVCHGVSGNAWPWLLMAHSESKLTSDNGKEGLGRALAFLLHSTEMPPMSYTRSPYRLPDNPFSMFEGLAGAICSWSEACVVISSLLGEKSNAPLLGMPCIGGVGITGLL